MKFGFSLFLILIPYFSQAQDSTAAFRNIYPAGDYFLSYLTDTRDMLLAPAGWDDKDILGLAGMVAGTTVLMAFDEEIHDEMFSQHWADQVSKYGLENFGDGAYSLPVLAGLYIAGKVSKNPYDCEVALLGAKTFVINGGFTRVIKYTFQRHRPTADDPPDAFYFEGPFHGITEHKSFVSGHASSAFALATVLAEAYKGKKRWVPWVAYSLAAAVSLSRVYDGSHWSSDVFAGAAFGYFSGKFMFRINAKNR
jgi:PAP2 superfamily